MRVVRNPVILGYDRVSPIAADNIEEAFLVLDPLNLTPTGIAEAARCATVDMLQTRLHNHSRYLQAMQQKLDPEMLEIQLMHPAGPFGHYNTDAHLAFLRGVLAQPEDQQVAYIRAALERSVQEAQRDPAPLIKRAQGLADWEPLHLMMKLDQLDRDERAPAALRERADYLRKHSAPDKEKTQQAKQKLEQFKRRLPKVLRDWLTAQPPTVIVCDSLGLLNGSLGGATRGSNIMTFDGHMLEHFAPDHAYRIFKEEVLHLIDWKIGFSASQEWQDAAWRQIESGNPAFAAALKRTHEASTKLGYGGTRHDATAPAGCYPAKDQPGELLVDYFLIKDQLAQELAQEKHKKVGELEREEMGVLKTRLAALFTPELIKAAERFPLAAQEQLRQHGTNTVG